MSTLNMSIKRDYLLRKIFPGNLNEAFSLAEIDVILKLTAISTNKIALFQFPRKISEEVDLYNQQVENNNKFYFKNELKFVVNFNLLIVLIWQTYQYKLTFRITADGFEHRDKCHFL